MSINYSSRKYVLIGSHWIKTSICPAPPCPVHQVWVSSPHNATGYYTVYGEEALHADHFNTKLSFGDTQTVWARTGYLGFLRRTELTDASGGQRPFRRQLCLAALGTRLGGDVTGDWFCLGRRAP